MGNRQGNADGSAIFDASRAAVVGWVLLAVVLAAVWWIAVQWSWTFESLRVPAALAVSFGLLAYILRGVSRSGALAGALIAMVITDTGGLQMFVVLVAVFALTWMATRLGRERKQRLGIAERPKGRNGAQVLANLWAAAMAIVLNMILPWHYPLHITALAALAEAASDTVSSEIGEAFGKRPRLITNWREVPVGTDGGVSLVGVLAGLIAALVIGFAGVRVRLSEAYIAALCGFGGMICDSFLGALFERRGWITNNVVNFLSTCVAAALGFLIVRFVIE